MAFYRFSQENAGQDTEVKSAQRTHEYVYLLFSPAFKSNFYFANSIFVHNLHVMVERDGGLDESLARLPSCLGHTLNLN